MGPASLQSKTSSLGKNYLVTELEIALVFFNDQMSQTIVEHQEKAAFAEQVARRVGRKFHGGEEKQVWGAQVNIVGRVGQRQDYIHLIQDNPIEQLFGHIELLQTKLICHPNMTSIKYCKY